MIKYVTIAIVILLLLPAALFADSEDAFGFLRQNESVRLGSTPVISGAGDSLALLGKEESQPTSREETLISGEIESGGCGGPVIKLSGISNNFALFIGGRGGWIVNHSFLIGGAAYGLATDVFISGNKLHMGYGGLWVEYIINSDELVHFTAGTLIGMGIAHYDPEGKDQRTYFVLEPEANVEINIVRFFRVCAGVSYRMAMGFSGLAGLDDAALSGLSANLFLKFGNF